MSISEKTMHELALEAKKKNIIDMALGFAAMMRLFEKKSDDLIKDRLALVCGELEGVDSEHKFKEVHDSFCEWFTQTIKLAKTGETASYGHGAKVLDISLKVYVYYCRMPDQVKADYLAPFLNGAIDTPILRHLLGIVRIPEGKSLSSHLWNIAMINRDIYNTLQLLIRSDIADSFAGEIWLVQYDDIMWRRLNRTEKSDHSGTP
jgi:hypothetical protein